MRALILVPLLAGCAHQDEWRTEDTVWQSVYTVALLADAYAASKIHEHPNIVESGTVAKAIMGENPDTSDAVVYALTLGFTNWLIARSLPHGWRTIWQVGTTIPHVLAVNEAHQIGLFGEPCTRHQEEHPC